MKRILSILIFAFIFTGTQHGICHDFALKTNVPEWFIGTPNLSIEKRFAPKWTAEVGYAFAHRNLYHTLGFKQLDHWEASGEARYWWCSPFNGYFVGLEVAGGEFNINRTKLPFIGFRRDSRYEGWDVKGGVSLGYSWILAGRFNVEAELGLGVIYLNYRKYDCATCGKGGDRWDRVRFTPTRAAIKLVYKLK